MTWWFVVLCGRLAQRRNCLFRVISLLHAWSTFNKELLILSNASCLLLVLGRLQRRSGWRDLEYGPRELWQPQVCSFCNLITLHCQDMFLTNLFCYRPVHGLIFLFKWQPGEEPAGSIVQDSRLDHIFFAKQVLWASFYQCVCVETVVHITWKSFESIYSLYVHDILKCF